MNNKVNIDILLSTYNGERFLSEQIDSILAQTNTSWRLLIRDDGSKDNTGAVIREYVEKYPEKIIWINKDKVCNVGVLKSFEILMSHSTSPYFMFCDQDDVWLPTKVEDTLNIMNETETIYGTNIPIVVHTDLCVVDGNLNVINNSLFKMSEVSPKLVHSDIKYALLFNCITGCTEMGNKVARMNALPFPWFAEMHDSWVARKAWIDNGKVITLYKATILYRQHGFNVVGASPTFSLKERWFALKKSYNQFRIYSKYPNYIAFLVFIFYKYKFKVKCMFN